MTKYSTLAVVFLFGFLGHTYSQENTSNVKEVLDKIFDVADLNKLNISTNTNSSNLNTTVIQTIDDFKNAFKQKCDKNAGPGAYENTLDAKDKLELCLKSFVNIAKLEEEMEKYKPSGDLDIVFKHYCHKTPVLKNCVSSFNAAVEPCLEPVERESIKIFKNITNSLLDFVCYKDGDRIALFISADGPECLQSKQQKIQQCINTTVGSYLPQSNLDNGSYKALDSLPLLILGTNECRDIVNLQKCVVKELEQCSDPTPANIVDSIVKFILKETPCKNVVADQSIASTSKVSLLVIAITVFLLRLT